MKAVRAFNAEAVGKPQSLEAFTWPEAFLIGAEKGLPLDLEIGCGVGFHPIRYAKENPERHLIAIEHTREKFQSFERRANAHPLLTNLLPVHADAVRWVTHGLKPSSIDRVLLLYPNPEPRAANKRWFRAPFFYKLIEVMKPGAELILATNILSYMDEAVDYAREVWPLDLIERREITPGENYAGIPRTHFEKKYLARGETCFDVTFRKR